MNYRRAWIYSVFSDLEFFNNYNLLLNKKFPFIQWRATFGKKLSEHGYREMSFRGSFESKSKKFYVLTPAFFRDGIHCHLFRADRGDQRIDPELNKRLFGNINRNVFFSQDTDDFIKKLHDVVKELD